MNLRKCPDCGANLDPDEKCDCKDKIKSETVRRSGRYPWYGTNEYGIEIIWTDGSCDGEYVCQLCHKSMGGHSGELVFRIQKGKPTVYMCKDCIMQLGEVLFGFNCRRLGMFASPYVYAAPDRFGREEIVEFEPKTAAEIAEEEIKRMFVRKAARSSCREDRQFSEVRLDEYVRPEIDKEFSYDIPEGIKCGIDFANGPDWTSQVKVAEEFIEEAEKMKKIVNSSHGITQDILDTELMGGFRGGKIPPDLTKIEKINSEIKEDMKKEKNNEIK